MGNFKIDHERPGCIGCGACAAVSPEFWKLSDKDGKSDLIGSREIKEGDTIVKEQMDISEDKLAKIKEAADSCPVNVIHILDSRGQKFI